MRKKSCSANMKTIKGGEKGTGFLKEQSL
jgi:hypothetical protein